MPPRQTPNDTSNSTETEEEKPPVKVNKWDSNSVKNALDDCVKKVAQEHYGYGERTTLMNLRLLLSIVAVGFAGFALVWDWFYPFPKSRPILIMCVMSYFTLMGVLQLFTWYMERGIFFQAIDEDPTGATPDAYWDFLSKMKKYDDMYTLEIEMSRGNDFRHAKIVKSVTSWIDEEGTIGSDLIKYDVQKMHDSLLDQKKMK